MSPQRSNMPVARREVAQQISEQQIEAARYVLLRRLAASLRHHLVRQLQPIGMIFSVMDHKAADATLGLHTLHEHAAKMNDFAKAALAQCMDTDTWLSPDPDFVTPLNAGIDECLDLVSANLTFRGYEMRNEVAELPVSIGRSALRSVLTGSVLAMSDELAWPATLVLRAFTEADQLTLTLHTEALPEGEGQFYDDGYRKMLWSDVEALAAGEGVAFERNDETISMVFTALPMRSNH